MRRRAAFTRRALLKTAAASAALTAIGGIARPSLSFAPDRAQITHGVQSGDVSVDSGVVWARADRPSRMLVEVATTDSFRDISSAVFVDALPEADFTAKALHRKPAAGSGYLLSRQFPGFVLGRFRRGADAGISARRRLQSVPSRSCGRAIRWARVGASTRRAAACALTPPCARTEPDFFIHCGDNIYADCPIAAEQKLPDGTMWRSIVTEEKSKPAETLAEYRGNYKYNLLDDNLRAFNAAVPTFALWDNNEVMETWWPDEPLPLKPLGEKNTLVFAARARRAFHEFLPMRETMAEPGRVYRKIQYGPLLDVFMLDMRSYRGSEGPHGDSILTTRRLSARAAPGGVAQARIDAFARRPGR